MFSNSLLKSERFRTIEQLLWLCTPPHSRIRYASIHSRRFTNVPVLLLHHHPHILHHCVQIHSYTNRNTDPFRTLFRRRLPNLFVPMSSMNNSSQEKEAPTARTVRVLIKGRVQGVFYRNWTIENAKELGLKGWVRNRRDGSVEALFSGYPEKVDEMEQRCRRGPPDAMVTALQVFPSTDAPGNGFERKQTV